MASEVSVGSKVTSPHNPLCNYDTWFNKELFGLSYFFIWLICFSFHRLWLSKDRDYSSFSDLSQVEMCLVVFSKYVSNEWKWITYWNNKDVKITLQQKVSELEAAFFHRSVAWFVWLNRANPISKCNWIISLHRFYL